MVLKVSDAARILAVSEQQIYRWIRERSIPFTRVSEQYRFNRHELLEWATRRHMAVSVAGIALVDAVAGVALADAIERGGVYVDVMGDEREAVLSAIVERIRLPDSVDRGLVLEMLLARDVLEWVGDGVAVPQVRCPLVLGGASPSASLWYLAAPMAVGPGDAHPVSAIFLLVTPTVRSHVNLVAMLGGALRDEGFRSAVKRRAVSTDIVTQARRVEASLEGSARP